MAVVIRLQPGNIKAVRDALKRRSDSLDQRLSPTAANVSRLLLSMVQKKFAAARRAPTDSPPFGWAKMAPLTRFIRAHKQGKTDRNPKLLNDTGLLANANFPFVRRGGKEFGVANNLRYASKVHFGGTTSAGQVGIKGFKRKSKLGKVHNVKPYTLKTPGGRRIPARPFFPAKKEYLPEVLRLVRRYVSSSIQGGGNA